MMYEDDLLDSKADKHTQEVWLEVVGVHDNSGSQLCTANTREPGVRGQRSVLHFHTGSQDHRSALPALSESMQLL